MKYFTLILILLAVGLIGYNITLIDFGSPFEEDSIVALIGIFSALCAILLLVIFTVSKKIQDKLKNSK
ncbi:hypothetical protein LS482_05385 [Sinomicrobium kalidii]|uniref:hypothetical protein n=1 Tax=Sinomicrobium kalidii TaxID=2900738 RepID=UPI001E5FDA0F|nr:hypothetical protein [Sinomicrobium kalidii]UGU17303.1 hypothetical protein LS482_05385 [Sinomicrobium kalidii]